MDVVIKEESRKSEYLASFPRKQSSEVPSLKQSVPNPCQNVNYTRNVQEKVMNT